MEVEDHLSGVGGEEIDPLTKALCEKCPPLGDYLGEREHAFEHVKDRYLTNNWKRSLLKKEIPEKDGKSLVRIFGFLDRDYGTKASDYVFEQLMNLWWLSDLYSDSTEDYRSGIIPRLYHQPAKMNGKRNDADRRSLQKKRKKREREKDKRHVIEIDRILAKKNIGEEERRHFLNAKGLVELISQPDEEGPPEFGLITVPPSFSRPLKAFICHAMTIRESARNRPLTPLPQRIATLLNCAGILYPRTNRPFTDQDIRNLNKGCANYLE